MSNKDDMTDNLEKEAKQEADEQVAHDAPAHNDHVIEGEVVPEQEAATAETEPSLEEQLDAAKAEAAKNLDGWLRAQADLANARKRFQKQRAETYVTAKAEAVVKLLPVLDDFERALDSVPEGVAEDGWFAGIGLVQRKLVTILEGMDVQPIEAVGQPFDPNYHEAISQEPTDDYESGVVMRELQKGYQLGERVIRPSLVVVAA